MGHSHAVSGMLGWVIATPAIAAMGLAPDHAATLAAGGVIAAGGAMLPDLDHPSASISRSLGPITGLLARLTSVLSGGHRQWTHTLWFVLLVFAAMYALGRFAGETGALIVTFLMSALALDALHLTPRKHPVAWTVVMAGLITAVVAWMSPAGDYSWIAWPMAIGVFMHLAGDVLTPGGLPLLPWKGRFSLPVLPSTGGFMETGLLTPIMVLAVFVIVLVRYTPATELVSNVLATVSPGS